MRENERKTGACSTSLPKLFLTKKLKTKKFSKNLLVTKCSLGIIYHQNNTNYQIDKSKKLLHRDNLGRNQKRETKKVKNNGRKFHKGCEISQGFRNPREIGKCFSLFSASVVLPSGSTALSSN